MKPTNYSANNNNGGVTAANFLISTIRYKNTGSCWLCTAKHSARQTPQGNIQTLPRVKINKFIRGINAK